ncbi:MAG: hypothetical protein R3C62_20320 [Chloroflexota bacterium]
MENGRFPPPPHTAKLGLTAVSNKNRCADDADWGGFSRILWPFLPTTSRFQTETNGRFRQPTTDNRRRRE